MSRTLRRALLLAVVLVPLASWQVWALTDGSIARWTVDGGGARSSGGDLIVRGTAGQPDAGTLSGPAGSGLELRGGFWPGAAPVATGTGDTPVAGRHELVDPYPNPFNPQTTVQFELAQETDVFVEILDTRGRRVRTLVDGARAAGVHTLQWSGRTDDGAAVASGVYYLRLIADGQVRTRKMTLLK